MVQTMIYNIQATNMQSPDGLLFLQENYLCSFVKTVFYIKTEFRDTVPCVCSDAACAERRYVF